jgi:hypothetical protein
MKYFKYACIAVLLSAATSVWAEDEDVILDRPSFAASSSMIVTAEVQAINHETRVVTVRQHDGEEITFTASEEARNLDQVEVGDVLVAEFVETLSVKVLANDGMEPEAVAASAMARTAKGEMPGFAAMDATVVATTVEEINIEMNTFKLKYADGTINEYTARDPENLKRAKVGDLVIIAVTSSVAITVEEQAAE